MPSTRTFNHLLRLSRRTAASHFQRRHTNPITTPTTRLSTRRYTEPVSSSPDDIKIDLGSAFKTHNCDAPATFTYTNKNELMDYFTNMTRIRRMELLADRYYKEQKIRGFCHLYDGQEAVCIGAESVLTKDDHVITAYREHGWAFTRGDTIYAIFAEMFGHKTGCARGKGGSMHLYHPEGRFYGGNGIVGAQVPVGTGVAWGIKYSGAPEVCVVAYGDGAANQGQVFESYNMAALYNLPVIYLCENNKYGMGTSTSRAAACDDFYTRGHYIPGLWVDGMNVLSVREAFRFAKDWCVDQNNGPLLIEAETYRYHGHSMSDPGITYRSRDEVDQIRNQFDPITKVKSMITEAGFATDTELRDIEKTIRKEVEADAKQALADGELSAEELKEDIYATGVPPFVRYSSFDDSFWHNKSVKEIYPNM